MRYLGLSIATKFWVVTAVFLWASAFVGIRMGLQGYSPGGLALLRFIIASICMVVVFFRLEKRSVISSKDFFLMLFIGATTMGGYHVALNYGEMTVPSGIASFIISQSPVMSVVFAMVFLRERLNGFVVVGMTISFLGMIFILFGQENNFNLSVGVLFVCFSAATGSVFSVLQKPFLKKYHAAEVTSFMIWGGTLAFLFYTPDVCHEIFSASALATCSVIYLGIFPAAVAYLAWSYVLSAMPASRAVNFLYFMPLIATLLGWIVLNEIPPLASLAGGIIGLLGVWIVNYGYSRKPTADFIEVEVVE